MPACALDIANPYNLEKNSALMPFANITCCLYVNVAQLRSSLISSTRCNFFSSSLIMPNDWAL